jgi:hypothetical protein
MVLLFHVLGWGHYKNLLNTGGNRCNNDTVGLLELMSVIALYFGVSLAVPKQSGIALTVLFHYVLMIQPSGIALTVLFHYVLMIQPSGIALTVLFHYV